MISLDSKISFASTNIRAEIFQLRVTCRRGQATSMPLDYYAPGGGGGGGGGDGGSLNMSFVCVFFFFLFSFFFH